MKLVDRLILRELMGPLINSVLMFLMLLFASYYLFKVTELLVQGVDLMTVIKVALYSIPTLFTQTLPMGMLLGTLLAFGRLSGDSEHIALFATGVSFTRIVRPVAFVGVVVSIIAFAWNETVVPRSMRAYYDLIQNATERIGSLNKPVSYVVKRPEGEGVSEFVTVENGYDAKTQTLRKVTILKMSDDPAHLGEPEGCIYADRVSARDEKGVDWTFYDVYVRYLKPDPKGKYVNETHVDVAQTLPMKAKIGRTFRGVMEAGVTDNRRMTFRELRDKINRERAQGNLNTAGDEVDLWEKCSTPMASLIVGVVGAPLGVRPQRSGKTMGFGIAILLIFLYWVVYHWMYLVGKGGGIPPILASFVANILGAIAAIILIVKARQ